MEIECGNYILKSDSMNLWIEEKCEVKKGKRAGQVTTKVVTGYHRDFEHLLDSFAMKRVRNSDAETMKQFLQDIKVIESDLRELARELGRKLGEVAND